MKKSVKNKKTNVVVKNKFLRNFIIIGVVVLILLFVLVVFGSYNEKFKSFFKIGDSSELKGELASMGLISTNNFCEGADINKDGKVDKEDVRDFFNNLTNCQGLDNAYALLIINKLNDPNFNKNCNANNKFCELLDINLDGTLANNDALILTNRLNTCTSIYFMTTADFNNDRKTNSQDRPLFLSALEKYPIGTNSCGFINGTNKKLLSHWKFEDNYQDSQEVNHGIANGNPSFVDGKIGKALSLDGINDYIRIPYTNFPKMDSISVSAWIKTNSVSKNSHILTRYGPSGVQFSLYHAGQNPTFYINNGGDSNRVYSTKNELTTGWHYIVGVFDSNTKKHKVFVDGKLAEERTYNVNLNNPNTDMIIGDSDYHAISEVFYGSIDEVKIWNYALSDEEVKNEYESGINCIDSDVNLDYSDGKNFYDKGKIIKNGNIAKEDICRKDVKEDIGIFPQGMDNPDLLAEYFCNSAGEINTHFFNCLGKCINGRCVENIANWKFEDNYYDSIGDNHGTVKGNPQFVKGKIGKALKFDGNDYIDVPRSGFLKIQNDITVGAWINPNSVSGWQALLEYSEGNNIGMHFYLKKDKLFVNLVTTDSKSHMYVANDGLISPNKWSYVLFTRKGSEVKFYVDGQSFGHIGYDNYGNGGQIKANELLKTDYDLQIGIRKSTNSLGFRGDVDEVRIWYRALSEDEVKTEYELTKNEEVYDNAVKTVKSLIGCSDSDKNDEYLDGKNYYQQGFTIWPQSGAAIKEFGKDYCSNNKDNPKSDILKEGKYLVEHYCEGNLGFSEVYECSGKCVLGACSPKPAETCKGCLVNGKCHPVGYRDSGKYCSKENNFVAQLDDYSISKQICINDFQCKSNICYNKGCISETTLFEYIKGFNKNLLKEVLGIGGGKGEGDSGVVSGSGGTKKWSFSSEHVSSEIDLGFGLDGLKLEEECDCMPVVQGNVVLDNIKGYLERSMVSAASIGCSLGFVKVCWPGFRVIGPRPHDYVITYDGPKLNEVPLNADGKAGGIWRQVQRFCWGEVDGTGVPFPTNGFSRVVGETRAKLTGHINHMAVYYLDKILSYKGGKRIWLTNGILDYDDTLNNVENEPVNHIYPVYKEGFGSLDSKIYIYLYEFPKGLEESELNKLKVIRAALERHEKVHVSIFEEMNARIAEVINKFTFSYKTLMDNQPFYDFHSVDFHYQEELDDQISKLKDDAFEKHDKFDDCVKKNSGDLKYYQEEILIPPPSVFSKIKCPSGPYIDLITIKCANEIGTAG